MTEPRSVAIVELTGVHEEIIPSLVDALPAGTAAHVFVNARCRDIRGDLFAELAMRDITLSYVPIEKAADWQVFGELIDAGGHDALIVSTLQLEGTAVWASARAMPLVGVVHNPIIFNQSATCSALRDEGRMQTIVLAPHVQTRLNGMTRGSVIDGIGVIEPVYWGECQPSPWRAGAPKRVIVPGGINFSARDFKGLIDALDGARVARVRESGLELQVIGGGPDRAALVRLIAERGLGDVVTLLDLGPSGRVPYASYVAALREAWAIYPLLPLGALPYRDHKITSAIPTAIGFGLPVVLDRWTEGAYRVPALVSDASIGAALEALTQMDIAARASLCSEIVAYGMAARGRNREELSRMLKRGRRGQSVAHRIDSAASG
jgi:glycosyltransferase involved in cell wall biosynthesis